MRPEASHAVRDAFRTCMSLAATLNKELGRGLPRLTTEEAQVRIPGRKTFRDLRLRVAGWRRAGDGDYVTPHEALAHGA